MVLVWQAIALRGFLLGFNKTGHIYDLLRLGKLAGANTSPPLADLTKAKGGCGVLGARSSFRRAASIRNSSFT